MSERSNPWREGSIPPSPIIKHTLHLLLLPTCRAPTIWNVTFKVFEVLLVHPHPLFALHFYWQTRQFLSWCFLYHEISLRSWCPVLSILSLLSGTVWPLCHILLYASIILWIFRSNILFTMNTINTVLSFLFCRYIFLRQCGPSHQRNSYKGHMHWHSRLQWYDWPIH